MENFRYWLICFASVFLGITLKGEEPRLPIGFEFKVSGVVYRDDNLNGVREGYDHGIGGIVIHFPDSSTVVTNAEGRFKKSFRTVEATVRVFVEKNSIPAGGVFTSPTEFFLSRETGSVRNFEFGVHYPKGKTDLHDVPKEEVELPKEDSGRTFTVTRKNNQIFVESELWQVYQQKPSRHSKSNFNVDFQFIPLEVDQGDIDKAVSEYKKASGRVSKVLISTSVDSEGSLSALDKSKAETVNGEVKFRLVEGGVNEDLIELDILAGGNKCTILFIEQEPMSEECFVEYRGTAHQLKEGEQLDFPYPKEGQESGTITCLGKKGVFESPRIVEKANKPKRKSFSFVENDQKITLIHSPYLDESRDLNVFFQGESGFSSLKINGDSYSPSNFSLVFKGQRGLNNLNFSGSTYDGKDFNYNFPFTLFKQPKLFFDLRWGQSWKKSNSDSFNTNYAINNYSQIRLATRYFYDRDHGFKLSLLSDFAGKRVKLLDNSVQKTRHIDAQLQYAYRYPWEEETYFTPKVTVLGGLFYRSFDPGPLTSIHVGKSITGFVGGAEIVFEDVSSNLMDLATRAEIGISTDISTGQIFHIAQEARFSLNRIGKLFGVNSHYSFYTRYGFFDDMRLVLSLELDFSRIATEYVSSGNTTAWNTTFFLGFQYPLF